MSALYMTPTLIGEHVRLEPLSLDHVEGLHRAASEERATYGFTEVPHSLDGARSYVEGLLAQYEQNETVPFVQMDPNGRVVGATRYLTLRSVPERPFPFAVEIGGTWLAASVQRTKLNTEAKLLLFDFAFSQWNCVRVDLKTDARNDRSRTAIGRLGATFEGVLRQSQPSLVPGEEDLFRDTAYFSVLDSEWPATRERLRSLLA
jgi:N-acetyltransferase